MLRLHETVTGTARPLELRDPGHVSMYVCGPTVYGMPHLGHGRMGLVFDILRRYLIFSGLEVHFVSNVTDIDDKIIERAAEEQRSEGEVAAQYEAEWWKAMETLGILRPDESPHATEYVDGMVDLIGQLVERGIAYETSDGVYMDVAQVPGYGLLAGQSLESLRVGARVETNEEKRAPQDFALWKKTKEGEPSWPSPFGGGRPGWHTECVVMSLDLLGDGFDLHGGGQDLRFPHHENERAQAVALGREFARHWVHNGFVEVEGEKMSKSLGNFTSLPDLLARHDARSYRLLVLRSHYRRPIEVTGATVADAEKALERLDNLVRRFAIAPVSIDGGLAADAAALVDEAALAQFRAAMDDDLDTPGALALIFELVSEANAAGDAGDETRAKSLAQSVAVLSGALGLVLRADTGGDVDEETARLIAERDAARAAKDWARADALRDEMVTLGWIVEDGPSGTVVRR